MRCPVPYALLALFGWGLADTLVSAVRVRLGSARAALRARGKVRAAQAG